MTPHSFYLAGPMTGIPKFNFPAFDAAAAELRDVGYEVISPAELDDPATREAALASPDGAPGSGSANDESYGTFLARDVKLVIDEVDGVVTLPEWWKSRGARIEVFTAVTMGKPIYYLNPAEDGDIGEPFRFSELEEFLKPGDPGNGEQHRTPAGAAGPPFTVDTPTELDAPYPGVPEALSVASAGALPAGEERITSETGGQKGRKDVRMDLLPWEPLWEVARVYGYGESKYPSDASGPNYLKGFDWSLSYGAALRHLTQWISGETHDPEFGTHHLAHVAWHCFALMLFEWHDRGTDDRLTTLTELTPLVVAERTGRSEAARA